MGPVRELDPQLGVERRKAKRLPGGGDTGGIRKRRLKGEIWGQREGMSWVPKGCQKTSTVGQWWSICLPTQGVWVWLENWDHTGATGQWSPRITSRESLCIATKSLRKQNLKTTKKKHKKPHSGPEFLVIGFRRRVLEAGVEMIGLPWWFSSKESAISAEVSGATGSIPGSGRS